VIDAKARRPRIGAGYGGLSGPAIKPIALRMVHQAANAVKVPVIGIGGIASGEDAAEFMIAGASLVQVGTATFWDPASPMKIAMELEQLLPNLEVERAADLVGTLRKQSGTA
jgi:dihydroorotate dehydrogenase (NAD+) catalytic subunit